MKLPLSINPRPRTTDALCVGENSVDLIGVVDRYPQADSKIPLVAFREAAGGESASAAVGLARLGWKAKYVGRFAGDRFGEFARQQLAAEHVDLNDIIVIDHEESRIAVVLVERVTGARTILWRRGPSLGLQASDIRDSTIAASRVLLVGSDDVDAMAASARRARVHDVRSVGDLERVHPGTPGLLRELDVVVMAASFPAAFTGHQDLGAALREVAHASGAALVCVTLGDEGCLALVGGEEVHVPSKRVDVVDTTGAGDLFRAGLIARWLAEPERPDVAELLRYANAVAALNCRGLGAFTAAPRPDEVAALLNA